MLSILDLLLTGLAGALWYVWPAVGGWPLVLVAAGLVVRLRCRPATAGWRRGPFDAPLALFLGSAVLGALLAYAPAPARAKLWTIVGGLALYGSVTGAAKRVRLGGRQFAPVSALLALFPVVLAAYFLLTNDWGRWAGKLAWLDPLTTWLASWQPDLPGHRLHPNVAGGLLAGLLPLQVAAVRRTRGGWAPVAFALLALLLTASRGAWLALAVAAAGVASAMVLAGRAPRRRTYGRVTYPPLLAVAAVAVLALIPWLVLAAGLVEPVVERSSLLRDSAALALDMPFTGLGLAGFQMAFSSYVLLLHVGHTIHSHNLFLNIWLEQGLLGLVAWGWLLAAAAGVGGRALSKDAERRVWVAAALAALGVILVHGLVDDAFYGSRGVLLLFLPYAVLAQSDEPGPDGGGRDRRRGAAVGMALAAGGLVAALLPGTRAAVQANLGALSQTRAELAVYSWPEWPIQDALRRQAPGYPPPVDLAPAMAHYRAALALDPHNVTANRRLGQIELSLGDYAAARQHLEAAYATAPWQRPTRQLLAEAYAVTGEPDRAAPLWASVDLSAGQLPLRTWWYNAVGEPERVRW